jgi:hypothetical protein
MAAAACGGESKPAKSPESNAGITETSSKEDMPPPPSEKAQVPSTDANANAAGPGAAGGVIKVAAMKFTPAKKGKNDKPIELKDDGTVTVDGKPAATIKGDQVDSTGGTSMLTVGIDGSLVGNGVKPGFKFEGDDLTNENGVKLSVGDDGTITSTKDGKSEPIAKAEGGAAAKRAALIVTVLYLSISEPVTKAGAKATATPAMKK